MHHPTDRITHTTALFFYTSCGAPAGMWNSSVGLHYQDQLTILWSQEKFKLYTIMSNFHFISIPLSVCLNHKCLCKSTEPNESQLGVNESMHAIQIDCHWIWFCIAFFKYIMVWLRCAAVAQWFKHPLDVQL